MKRFILVIISLLYLTTMYSVDYYGKHIIIVVDQTPDLQGDPHLKDIYSYIKNNLLGNQSISSNGFSSSITFNEDTDELSLFTFALSGAYHNNGDYMSGIYREINVKANNGAEENEVYKLFTKHFIQKRAKFSALHKKGLSLEEFIKTQLLPLFSQKDALHEMISKDTGVTFSRYVYPCILENGYIDYTVPASEYIIIIVSNFQSGLDDLGTSKDVEKMRAMLGFSKNPKYVEYFERRFAALEQPFYQIPIIKTVYGDSNSRPSVLGSKLGLKSLQGISVYLISNLNLIETGYNEPTYKLDDVEISFNHNKNLLVVDSINLKITDKDGLVHKGTVTSVASFDENKKCYTIKNSTLNLGKVYHENDRLKFQYVFYTKAIDEKGNALLPLVFIADRDFEFTSVNIISPAEDRTTMIMICISILLILVALTFATIKIYISRGYSRVVTANFAIWPITHTKFMEVKDKKVSSFDCWYWRPGETNRNIYVSGLCTIKQKVFAKKYRYRVDYWIEDIDINEDFSFKPDPRIKELDGSERTARKYYEVPMDPDGKFSFNANVFLEPGMIPNFNRENILSMKIKIRVVMVDSRGKLLKTCCDDSSESDCSKEYHFIVKPAIDNSNLWMAFDPGTTGACIAYGVCANPNDKDDIYLAENEYDRLDNGKDKSHIFPSKIRVNKNSNRLFADGGYSVRELEEGDEEDFMFGNQAEILWNENGVNCFQSIKKLLGYTTLQKIVDAKGNIKEISGQDLAYMLVCGLYNHFQDYVKYDRNVDTHIRNMFFKNEEFCPQRAIVAVPNNYTLVKIQEMVDTIKRTNMFKEVHFLYESEGVMMVYCRENWKQLDKLQHKVFVVFDMGGATINATVFRIQVNIETNKGNSYIRSIDVGTKAKIGYGVGGDDIDFAIIQILYNIPSVKDVIGGDSSDHQRKYKGKLIELAREIKLSIIDKENQNVRPGNIVESLDLFYGHIRTKFDKELNVIIPEITEKDSEYLLKEYRCHSMMEKYVFQNVTDAIEELLSSIDRDNNQVELIMSGRSVLYPGIKEHVIEQILNSGFICEAPWSGFNDVEGHFSPELVKTVVAIGACWYAMYSDKIAIHHDILTSTFGYIDMVGLEQKFIPVLERNTVFNNEGVIKRSVEPKAQNLSCVKFVQMLGNNYDEILDKRIQHKFNILDEVHPEQIPSRISHIDMFVDNKNNFTYEIFVEGLIKPVTKETNPYSRLTDAQIKTEITDENSEAYLFATRNALVEDELLGHIRVGRRF